MALLRAATRLQSIITKIAQKHGLDMDSPDANIKVSLGQDSAFMPLVIAKTDKDRITVAHYYYQNGDQIGDPHVELWIAPDGKWYPVAIEHPPMMIFGREIGGFQRYVDFDKGKPSRFFKAKQYDLACFCNSTWAPNIKWQSYLEDGMVEKKQ